MTDDFWGPGTEQWDIFSQTMNRVFPGKQITEIEETDSSMHVLAHDIREQDRTFIPGSRHLRRGADGSAQVIQPPAQPRTRSGTPYWTTATACW